MEGREIVSIDGEIFNLKDGKISILDHCFLYGDGIFEGIRLINKKILLHKEHMNRIYNSASLVRIPMVSKEEYEKQLFSAVRASNLNSGYIRLVVTRGIGDLGINPAKCSGSKLVILVTSLKLYPEELYEKGLKIIVARTRKIPYASFDCRIKSCNYMNNVMATWELVDRGADEAIMTDENGIVSEATVDNIFGIRGNTLFTPSLDTNCLEGITRNKIMEIAKGQKLNVVEGRFTARDFMLADEVFLTGTGAGIIPVSKIENKMIGAGNMGHKTRKLREEYESRIEEFCTPVN
ncbi:MAG TPA: branched-chain-amino-acid transaminase [Candidatus Nanoarchaeia archaeon]|nr:branched-chain-amino-acid transaminase [Candidatus Nanoarchaeia archaeon]